MWSVAPGSVERASWPHVPGLQNVGAFFVLFTIYIFGAFFAKEILAGMWPFQWFVHYKPFLCFAFAFALLCFVLLVLCFAVAAVALPLL